MKLPSNRSSQRRLISSPLGSASADHIPEAQGATSGAGRRGRSVKAREWLAVGLVLLLLVPSASLAVEFRPAQTLPGADLFTNGAVRQLRIEMAPSGVESLRRDPRQFVRATVKEEGTVYDDVAIHLKGSVGSFREVDDKPDLTLDFNRFNTGRKFHGLRRIHLNNSVEDPSYCNELLGGELFRAAGIPAPRVAHAVVTLNGRRLGLYVLKEGFTEDFLGCYFKQVGGNLYEPGEPAIEAQFCRGTQAGPCRACGLGGRLPGGRSGEALAAPGASAGCGPIRGFHGHGGDGWAS